MASQYSQVDVSPPKTLVTDVPPSQLKPNESPDLRNVVTTEADTVRRRRGFRRKLFLLGETGGIAANNEPVLVGVRSVDRKALLHYRTFAGAEDPANWAPVYHYAGVDGSAFGLDPLEGADYTVLVESDLAGNLSIGNNTNETFKSCYGKTIRYDAAVYGITTSQVASSRWRGFTGANGVTSTQLTRWSGMPGQSGGAITRVATATNASTTVTLQTSVAYSLTGYFMEVTSGTANAPGASYWYTYRVASHTAGTTAVVLDRPYGLDESGSLGFAPNLTIAAGDIVAFKTEVQVANAPISPSCVNLFKERIFTGRGFVLPRVGPFNGYYGNLLAWSLEGQPEKWPDQNFLLVDDDYNNPIMGMGTVAGMQVIFKRNKALIMTGDDEASFTIDSFLNNIGCVYSGSIMNFEDKLLWAGEDGIYAFDGETVDEITQPEPGRGIQKVYRSRMSNDDGTNSKFMMRYPNIHAVKNKLVVCLNEARESKRDVSFVYDTRNTSWCEFGRRLDDDNFSVDFVTNDEMFQGFFSLNNVVYGVLPWQIVGIDKCFDYEQHGRFDPDLLENFDQFWDNDEDPITILPNGVVQYPDLRLGDGDTVRLKEVQVEHNCHYHSEPAGANQIAWRFNLSCDPHLATVDQQYDVESRSVLEAELPDFINVPHDEYFIDRYPDAYSLEGAVFRVKLDIADPFDADSNTSDRLHRVRFLLEPTKTRLNRNQ